MSATRCLTPLLSTVLVILTVAFAAAVLYMWATRLATQPLGGAGRGAWRVAAGGARVEAVHVGPGFLLVYVRSLGGRYVVDSVYLYDINGRLVGYARLYPPAVVEPGRVTPITIPLLLVQGVNYTGPVRLVLSTREGVQLGSQITSLSYAVKAQVVVGLLAGRCCSCTVGDRSFNTSQIHWLYINLITGRYRFRYVDGVDVRDASGYARVLTGTNTLDLSKMSWEERYSLGPVIVFLNPKRAAEDYTTTIVDVDGASHSFTLTKLVDDPSLVAVDALVCWEDLWWPNTTERLDNYVDHVVRVTVFVNGTTRIEVLHAAGCYLHMFLYNPHGLPDFNTVPRIAEKYMENNYTLSESDSVVYVKTHGAAVPPLDPKDIWDPVKGEWVTTWPPVFRIEAS